MRIKRIIKNDISNGKSFRCSVFISKCNGVIWNKKTKRYDHCPGCFNSEAWAEGGVLLEDCIDEILENLKPEYIDGISILGGEPMYEENQKVVWQLIESVKKIYANKTIWLWTGFYKFHIPYTKYTKGILKNINVLIDGPFIKDKFDINLKYRGSSNQNIYDINKFSKFQKFLWNLTPLVIKIRKILNLH